MMPKYGIGLNHRKTPHWGLLGSQIKIQIVPKGESLKALEKDYAAVLEDGLLATHQPSFNEIIAACAELQSRINR